MIHCDQLSSYLQDLLQVHTITDYCPNGLQVAGRDEIKKLVTGVTASRALLEQALSLKADAILVHHGYFWRNEDPCIVGIKERRISLLLNHQINLFAYHLPLDIHPLYGNNAGLAQLLNIPVIDKITVAGIPNMLWLGELNVPITGNGLSERITKALNRVPLHIAGGERSIQKIAWCTGAAQDYLDQAYAAGCDAYITGEVSERTVHSAREYGIHFFAAGHHATERYGVQALGSHLAEKFSLNHQFVDIDNPV